MTFDFKKRGMLVGPEEFTFLTLKKCNWKKEGGGVGAQQHNSTQVQHNKTTHDFRICQALRTHVRGLYSGW